MKNIIKLLIFLGCCARYANAWHTPTECSLSRYTGSVRCVKLVYNEVNERLDKVYGDILRSLSKDDAAKFAKNYKDWTEERNGACREHSQDEIKFKSCRIDFTIPKLNELWEIESVSAKHPFEGKWADCFYRDGALV
ncbi:MAG: lysozyme inhibitor LprI family protein, partial [Campylobacteraceae bacterium]|nr:lysozyme inhibitor LprI family protein [Campylobacteraceae bacterium]